MSYEPAPPAGSYGQTPPQNYLVWAILTTVLCCLPFGIVSIVFSTQVNSKFMAGDLAGAQVSAQKAKTWAIVAAVSGLVASIIYVILMFTVLASGTLTETTY
ncbi:MAG: CD225/dispanin family protein [Actinomycetales bacterium]|nr:CD225/dispanin family protein [Actinomycetales bacterium]